MASSNESQGFWNGIGHWVDDHNPWSDHKPTETGKPGDHVKEAPKPQDGNQLSHQLSSNVTAVDSSVKALEATLKVHHKSTDKITWTDDHGHPQSGTYGDRVKQLKAEVNQRGVELIHTSDSIKQTGSADSVGAQLDSTLKGIGDKAAKLHVNPNTITSAELKKRIDSSNDIDESRQLQDLQRLIAERDGLKILQNAPAMSRTYLAELKSKGLTDPDHPLTDGKTKPSAQEALHAFDLLQQAGRLGDEWKSSNQYQAVSLVVNDQFKAGLSDRNKTIVDALALAGKPGTDAKTADAAYQKAIAACDQVDVGMLQAMQGEPRNKSNKAVNTSLQSSLTTVEHARLDYAHFLLSQGRRDLAMEQLVKAQGIDPKLVSNRDFADMRYQAQVVSEATVNKIEDTVGTKFVTAAQAGQYTQALGYGAQMIADARSMKHDVDAQNDRLNADMVKLNQEQDRLKTQSAMPPELVAAENSRINQERQAIQAQLNLKEADQANLLLAKSLVLHASLAHSHQDTNTAHREYLEAQQLAGKDSAFAKDPQLQLDARIYDSRPDSEKSWHERHPKTAKALLWAIPVAAGAIAGGLTIWLGPGAAVTGSAAFAATATALGLTAAETAIVAGATTVVVDSAAVAGSGYLAGGTSEVVAQSQLAPENFNAKRAFQFGGKIGAISATIFTPVGAEELAGADLAAGSTLGRVIPMAAKMQPVTRLIRGVAAGSTMTGLDMATGQKFTDVAGQNFLVGVLAPTSPLGGAGAASQLRNLSPLGQAVKTSFTVGKYAAPVVGTGWLLSRDAVDRADHPVNLPTWTGLNNPTPRNMKLDPSVPTQYDRITELYGPSTIPGMRVATGHDNQPAIKTDPPGNLFTGWWQPSAQPNYSNLGGIQVGYDLANTSYITQPSTADQPATQDGGDAATKKPKQQ